MPEIDHSWRVVPFSKDGDVLIGVEGESVILNREDALELIVVFADLLDLDVVSRE